MELGSGKSFDDQHRPTTLGAAPKRAGWMGGGGFWFGLGRSRAEQLGAKRQQSSTPPVGEETEVANADEALGEQVQQEAAQELI